MVNPYAVISTFMALAVITASWRPPGQLSTNAPVVIPLKSVYSTSYQRGLVRLKSAVVYKDGNEQFVAEYGYFLSELRRELGSMGASNIVLVRGESITEAIAASRLVFGGGRSGLNAALPNPESAGDPVWVCVYLGVGGSSPPKWLLEAVAVVGTTVRVTYRLAPRTGSTKDVHQYLYLAPLGPLANGTYTLELHDAERHQTVLTRVSDVG